MSHPVFASRTSPHGATEPVDVFLLAPRGFCAGVRRAIDAVTAALEQFGPPVYVRRAIVHNLAVVTWLEGKGAIFVQELDEVPQGSVLIFSAHGIARRVAEQAEERGLRAYDAVCPLVSKVHREVVRHHREGRHIFLIGHREHPEITGTLGQVPSGSVTVVENVEQARSLKFPRDAPAAYAIQTTFSMDEAAEVTAVLEKRFSNLIAPPGNDICYATTNRQAAVKTIASRVDAMLVVGEDFSSNARRLREVAMVWGCPAVQLVADVAAVNWEALGGCRSIAITAAASTPEASVTAIIHALGGRFPIRIRQTGEIAETAVFKPVSFARHAPGVAALVA